MTPDDLSKMVSVSRAVVDGKPLPPHSVVALDVALAQTVLELWSRLQSPVPTPEKSLMLARERKVSEG